MHHTARTKKALMINAASTTNAATASGYVDTKGFDSLSVDVLLTTSNDATNNPSVLKLQEGDTTSSFSDISGAVGDTDFTLPSCETAATNITGPYATINVDLRGRKRYINLAVSPVTTQTITGLATLGRASQTPSDAGASVLAEL